MLFQKNHRQNWHWTIWALLLCWSYSLAILYRHWHLSPSWLSFGKWSNRRGPGFGRIWNSFLMANGIISRIYWINLEKIVHWMRARARSSLELCSHRWETILPWELEFIIIFSDVLGNFEIYSRLNGLLQLSFVFFFCCFLMSLLLNCGINLFLNCPPLAPATSRIYVFPLITMQRFYCSTCVNKIVLCVSNAPIEGSFGSIDFW